ncbi:MAG: anti-sigma factor domain-containing protein [Solirubrobacteraceae bacterium]
MRTCREIEMVLAAHAFGALEPHEHEEVEGHIAGCPACRRAYGQMHDLPGLLDLAGGTDASIAAPPPLLEASVLAALPVSGRPGSRARLGLVRRWLGQRWTGERRDPRARVLAPALAAILAVVAIGTILLSAGPPAPAELTLTPSPLVPAARAVAILRPHPWGTEVDLRAEHLAPTRGTQVYEVWFVSLRGRVSAGTFTVGPQGRVTVVLASAARAGQYATLGVTLEPDGLNPARQGPNMLRAAVRT